MSNRDRNDDDNNDDVLDEAIAALREKANVGDTEAAANTRRHVLASAMKHRKRRAIVVRLVLPLAAVLLVSTAWAAATGRLPSILGKMSDLLVTSDRQHVDHVDHVATSPTQAAADEKPTAAIAEQDAATITRAVDEAIATTPTPTATATASASSAPSRTTTIARTTTTTPSTEDALDPEETLYNKAHIAHFTDGDFAHALVGWDAYLVAYPNGRFAPEAKYNRALALVRLGRRDEAKAALQPFADGVTFAGYRQKEAKSLLDAMSSSPAPPP
jgi:hypothetical protein